MHAVEVGGVVARVHHEKLRAARVFAGVGHAEGAALVVLVVAAGFAVDFVAGAAGAGLAFGAGAGVGAAALNDEVGNDAVKFQAVVVPLLGEVGEIFDGFRSILLVKLDFHNPFFGVDFGGFQRKFELSEGNSDGTKAGLCWGEGKKLAQGV